MNRPKIEQQVTFLAASDLRATASFYEEVLGLTLILDQGTCRIYQTVQDAFLGFCSHLEMSRGASPVILTLVSEEVDAWFAYLGERGVSLEKRPTLNPVYNIYHFFVHDPNGYLIEVQRFLDPSWSDRQQDDTFPS